MGVARVFTLVALLIAFFAFGLTAGLFMEGLQPREEQTANIESPTGLLPFDRIAQDDVHVYANTVAIDLPNVRWANFSATGSMLPVLGPSAHALQIIPGKPGDIHVGDIVSFRYEGRVIIHRVIEAGTDDRGTFYITQGDNNAEPDPLLVRFADIDRVVVAILY